MPVEIKTWEEAYRGCGWATAFSSPLWHMVTKELGTEATFEWKGIVTPLRKIKLAKGLIQGWESTVPGVPCGPICNYMPDESKIQAYWQELNKRTKGRFLIHLRPDSPFRNSPYRTIKISSHVLKVKEREKNLSEHHRRQIRKAREACVTVARARRDADLDAYREMYEASLKRWKSRPARIYTKVFFDRIKEYIIRADAGCFFIAWKDEHPQAAALILYESARGVYWHGASTDNPVPGSGHLLHWRIMEELEKEGMEEYEFGPSAGLEGVRRFKQGFGAKPEEHITVVGPARLLGWYFIRRTRR